MRFLRSYWPVAVFVLSSVAHADLVILARPAVQHALGIDLLTFVVAVVLFSSVQILFEYWFYGWCRLVAITDVWAWLRNGAWFWLQARGFEQPIRQIGAALTAVEARWHKLTNGWFKRRRALVVSSGTASLFAVSVSPAPGIRGPAIILCGVMRLRWGLAVVLVGNAIRTLYLVYGLRWLLAH